MAGQCGAEMPEPEVILCSGATWLQLYIVKSRADGDLAQWDTRMWSWNTPNQPKFPAPTLRMVPGTQCRINVTNLLPNVAANTLACKTAMDNHVPNHNPDQAIRCTDFSNIHTHGLHVSQSEDDMSVSIPPGGFKQYIFNVPANHMGGTHWYHPHHHGSTFLQVAGGMHGALFLDPPASSWPFNVTQVYRTTGGRHGHTVVMSQVATVGNGNNVWPDYVQQTTRDASGATIPPNPSAAVDVFVVNGKYVPTVTMPPNDVHVFRMINAGGHPMLDLEICTNPNKVCEWRVLAKDGVFLDSPYTPQRAVILPSGGRADVAIRCKPEAVGMCIQICSRGDSSIVRSYSGPMLNISIINDQLGAFAPYVRDFPSLDQVTRPTYLRAVKDDQEEAHMGIRLVGNAINTWKYPGYTDPLSWVRFSPKMKLGCVYQIDVTDEGNQHPYHQHINHFQMIETATDPDFYRVGEWRDTVPTFNTATSMKYRPDTFAGPTVVHCHYTNHEGNGTWKPCACCY
jgi:FtsP/CotA-like multicopper oxidase with cupredoxin domain